MAQVLHIFRKDVRHLRLRALVVLLLMAAHAVFDVRSSAVYIPETNGANSMLNMLNMLLPLGMWLLIAWLIFQEALPDDRQFWLTRPYRWPKLLAAKVLFILVFINLPLFLSDCYILGAQGFPVLGVFPDLLFRQLILTTLFILPSFAIATLTTGVSQFLLAWFILLLVPLAESMLESAWSRHLAVDIEGGSAFVAVLVATTCGIIVWQYARRRAAAARLAVLTVTCAFLPVMSGVSRLAHLNSAVSQHMQSPNRSGVQIAYDLDRRIPSQTSSPRPPDGVVQVRIPLTAEGVPPKTLLRGSALIAFDIGGTPWPEPHGFISGSVERTGGEYWQTMNIGVSRFNVLKQQPVDLHAAFDLEIVSDEVEARVPVTRRSFVVPGVGLCRTFQYAFQTQLTCRAGLGPSLETNVRLDSDAALGGTIAMYPPHQIPWGLSPATDLGTSASPSVPPGSEYAFIPRRKVTKFQQTLDLHNIKLADYTLPR